MSDPKAFVLAVETAWRAKVCCPAGKRLTRLHVHIAAKLAFWRSATCRQRSLARAAGCCTRTVQRALAVLPGLGLLSWTRRVLACRGWRAQVASAYTLLSCKPLAFQVMRSSASLSPPGRRAAAPGPVGDLLLARRAARDRQWEEVARRGLPGAARQGG